MARKEMTGFSKIRFYSGTQKRIEEAEALIRKEIPDFETLSESAIRLKLQTLIDTHKLRVEMLYNGNGVLGKNLILKDMRSLVKNGMETMSDRLYSFFSQDCGSIAHYNKHGWIDTYPTIHNLRIFFRANEFGQRVLHYIPKWKTDTIEIVKEMEKILGI